MDQPAPNPPEAMTNDVGGASKPKKLPPGWTFSQPNGTARNHQGSHSLVLSPLEEGGEGKEAIPLLGGGKGNGTVSAPVSGSASSLGGRGKLIGGSDDPQDLLPAPVVLVASETAKDWLEMNTPALLEAGARLALSGRDPMFRSMFFGKLLDHQREVQSATLKAKAGVLQGALAASASQKRLMEVAQEVEAMDPGKIMASLRSDGEDVE